MVSREHLKLQGLRAYEVGRLRAASRITLVLIPIAALCLFESRGREVCACLTVTLLGLCIWLRWRDRRGFEIVTTGLQAGGVPLLAGLVLDRFGLQCNLAGGSTFCTAFAALMGVVSGMYIGLLEAKWPGRFWSFITAGIIAALAAGLGCVRLGIVGVTSVIAGIALGIVVMTTIGGRK